MPQRPAVLDWFSRRRLGLFVHFGLYAIEGWHEQDQMRRRIPRHDYHQLMHRFNPAAFDPDAWLDLADAAGMEYLCLTTKHHDGFCLWDTDETDFKITNTPYGRDLVAELAEACHRRGMPLGLYYSVADWHHPAYPNRGRHHELPGPQPGDRPDWDAYMGYLRRQVRELCTGYGPVRHWFWDMNVPEYHDPSVNDMIRQLQPGIAINDRGFDEGDFGTPEREYRQDQAQCATRFDRSTEACNSVGTQSWGYRQDEDYYSTGFLIRQIDAMMARGAHYLLNVGPDARGVVPETASTLLREIGAWYRTVEEAFGDAEPATEWTTNPNVLLTRRDNTLYVHIPPPVPADAVMLPPIDLEPTEAVLLNTGEPLHWTTEVQPMHWQDNTRVLTVRGLPRHLLCTDQTLVIRLTFSKLPNHVETRSVNAFEG